VRHVHLLVFPVLVERAPEQDADAEVDFDEIRRHQLPVHHHAWGHEHLAAPLGHVPVLEVAVLGILKAAPASQQYAPLADALVAG
jgi:hypothetical protein